MAGVLKYNESKRQEILDASARSLFFYARAVLGFDWLGPVQKRLADFIQDPDWTEAAVLVYRGGLKSTLTTISYPVWRAAFRRVLYGGAPKFACKIIENTETNAKVNHFDKISQLFRDPPRNDFLQWLHQDMLPDGLRGWNTERIKFLQDGAAAPSISYWGRDSKFEGWHGNLIVLDDVEGAEADVQETANEESKRCRQRVLPLLERPGTDKLLSVGTPHGDNPYMYHLVDKDDGEMDNAKRSIKVFFLPILAPNGVPYEPHRFPRPWVEATKKETVWDQQYMLRRKRGSGRLFRLDLVRQHSFEWSIELGGGRAVEYMGALYDPRQMAEDGYAKPKWEKRRCRISDMRKYLHVDPTHRLQEEMTPASRKLRPSYQAIVVMGVAPDFNVFPLELWMEDADLPELAKQTIRLTRKWDAHKVTFEAIGAQAWFKHYLLQHERSVRRGAMHLEMMGDLKPERARMMRSVANRLVEAERSTSTSKEAVMVEGLAPWLHHGVLHVHLHDHEELLAQMDGLRKETQALDLLDAMAQGPAVWSPPVRARKRSRELSPAWNYVQALVRDRTHLGGGRAA